MLSQTSLSSSSVRPIVLVPLLGARHAATTHLIARPGQCVVWPTVEAGVTSAERPGFSALRATRQAGFARHDPASRRAHVHTNSRWLSRQTHEGGRPHGGNALQCPLFLSSRVEINVCNFARAAATSSRSNALAIPSSSLRSSSARRRLDAAARHADEPQPRCHDLLGTNSRPQSSQQ